jgi:hypothetical protein
MAVAVKAAPQKSTVFNDMEARIAIIPPKTAAKRH